jgi:hypothetical protein
MSRAQQRIEGMTYYDQVAEAAAFVRIRLGALAPRVGMVLGSGLGAAADAVANPIIVPNRPWRDIQGGCWRGCSAALR